MRVKDETGLDELLLGFPGARLSCPETLHWSKHLRVGTSGLPLLLTTIQYISFKAAPPSVPTIRSRPIATVKESYQSECMLVQAAIVPAKSYLLSYRMSLSLTSIEQVNIYAGHS
jgi:hypothetical protein